MTELETNLKSLGLTLPPAPKPIASYLPAVINQNTLIVSGQLPMLDGALVAVGPVSSAVSLEEAQQAARQCVLNGLAVARATLDGDLARLQRVVRIGVFVQSDDGFDQQAQVANGASDLLMALLGESGRHARAAVGVNALPLNASVEVEFTFAVS